MLQMLMFKTMMV